MKRPLRPAELNRRRPLRHARKVQRFDGPTPACLFCPEDRIEALRAVPFEKLPEHLKRKVIERHHPDGRDVSEWVIPVCRNCHAVESDTQEDLPRPLRAPQTAVERAAALLAADARFFRRLGEACQERSAMLEREVETLLGTPHPREETE